jgi:3-hydroxyisobutyrate dehydrogenase
MTTTSRAPVAFLGLGVMGAGMARRLVDVGFPVAVYNRTPEKAAPIVEAGARLAASPRDAARDAAVIVSMVADDAASRGLWLGDDGALAAAAPGTVLVEASTVSPQWIAELAVAAEQANCRLLDAPVTGSRTHAAEGQLLFLVGGADDALETARPVLAAMSRGVVHVGPLGSGALLKLANNFLCGVQAAALAECVTFVERAGLDRDVALRVLSEGAPGSPLVRALSARMADGDYAPHFHLELMAKDLAYAGDAARRVGVALHTAAAARGRFTDAVEAGLGGRDFSAVVEPIRGERAGR